MIRVVADPENIFLESARSSIGIHNHLPSSGGSDKLTGVFGLICTGSAGEQVQGRKIEGLQALDGCVQDFWDCIGEVSVWWSRS